MAAKKQAAKKAAPKKDAEVDLLDGMVDEQAGEELDLLDGMDDSSAEPWIPEEAGEGIQGEVTSAYEIDSDFSDDPTPVVHLKTKDGGEYQIRGYGSVLARELRDAAPQRGDVLAVKYFGEKVLKKGKYAGNTYRHYKVAIKRAPQNAAPAPAAAPAAAPAGGAARDPFGF